MSGTLKLLTPAAAGADPTRRRRADVTSSPSAHLTSALCESGISEPSSASIGPALPLTRRVALHAESQEAADDARSSNPVHAIPELGIEPSFWSRMEAA